MSLHKDPRTGIYLYRKVVPEALRPVFGKREFKVSLGTRDPGEARAKMHVPAAEYNRLVEDARKAVREGWSPLAQSLVSRWLLATDRDDRWLLRACARLVAYYLVTERHGAPMPPPAYAFESTGVMSGEGELARTRMLSAQRQLYWQQRMNLLLEMPSDFFHWPIEQIAALSGQHPLHVNGSVKNAIAHDLRHRMLRLVIARIRRQQPHQPVSQPYLIVNNVTTNEGGSRPPLVGDHRPVGLLISEALQAWAQAPRRKARNPTLVQEWELAVRRFMQMYGDIDMGLIRTQMVRDFRDKLLEVPSRARLEIRALPFDEQVAIAKRDGLDTLSPATVNKALSALRSITEHVIDKMSAIPLEVNAAKGAKFVELNDDDEEKRLPFDEDDFAGIFADLAIEDSTGISIETLFWIVLIAPFTGCRLEEIGTLRPGNIRIEQGIPYIAIERDRAKVRAEQAAQSADGQLEKRRKNQNAERDIPIHPILLRAGLLELKKRREVEGEEWLFPDLKPNKNGKRTQRVSRLFARYLEDLGITDDEKVFHSFRHSVRRNLRGRAIEEIVDLICGHADGKTGRHYGRGADMRPLYEVICLIDFKGPNWDKVVGRARELGGLSSEKASEVRQLGLGL